MTQMKISEYNKHYSLLQLEILHFRWHLLDPPGLAVQGGVRTYLWRLQTSRKIHVACLNTMPVFIRMVQLNTEKHTQKIHTTLLTFSITFVSLGDWSSAILSDRDPLSDSPAINFNLWSTILQLKQWYMHYQQELTEREKQ